MRTRLTQVPQALFLLFLVVQAYLTTGCVEGNRTFKVTDEGDGFVKLKIKQNYGGENATTTNKIVSKSLKYFVLTREEDQQISEDSTADCKKVRLGTLTFADSGVDITSTSVTDDATTGGYEGTPTVSGLTNFRTHLFCLTDTTQSGKIDDNGTVAYPKGSSLGAFSITSAEGGNGTAILSWEASTGAHFYEVHFTPPGGSGSSHSIASSDSTTVTLHGLTNGLEHVLRVKAVFQQKNKRLESDIPLFTLSKDSTNVVRVTPSASPTAPGTFAITSAVANNGQVTLTWPDVSGATSYNVQYGTTSGTYTTTLTSQTSPKTITSLTNGTTYYFRVVANNSFGSTNSAEVSAVPVTPPGAFTITSATAGNAQVAVAWGNSSGATAYDLKYGTSTGTYTTTLSNQTSPTTVSSLTNGTAYYFMVVAKNSGTATTNASAEETATPAAPPSGWAQQAYVKAVNADAGDLLGKAVAIDGDTAVVGVRDEASDQTTITNGTTASSDNDAASAGAVYVYLRTSGSWAQQAYIKAPNAEAVDGFGYSVAISGDTIVASALGEDSNQTTITNGATASSNNGALGSGAVYVFTRSSGNWSQQAYIKPPNTGAGDNFGISVAIDADTVVVGAEGEDSNETSITNGTTASADNSNLASGAAYVFLRTAGNWAQEAYLKPSNSETDDGFGTSVAVSGDTVVVGAPFEDANDTTVINSAPASSNNSAADSGGAYVFFRAAATWTEQAYLKPSNTDAGDAFGTAVAIDSDTIVVGSPLESSNQTTISNGTAASGDNSAPVAGAVYVFTRVMPNWSEQSYIKPPNAEAADQFGLNVAISGDRIIVGAKAEDSNQVTITNGTTASSNNGALGAGAAYVFARTGPNWAQQAYLKAPNSEADDGFGTSVAISSTTAIVGAPGEDSNQLTITNGTTASSNNASANSGAAYIFKKD